MATTQSCQKVRCRSFLPTKARRHQGTRRIAYLRLALACAGAIACARDLDEAPCPCEDGWICCAKEQLCRASSTQCLVEGASGDSGQSSWSGPKATAGTVGFAGGQPVGNSTAGSTGIAGTAGLYGSAAVAAIAMSTKSAGAAGLGASAGIAAITETTDSAAGAGGAGLAGVAVIAGVTETADSHASAGSAGPAGGGGLADAPTEGSCGIVSTPRYSLGLPERAKPSLLGIHGTEFNNVWAVGEQGTILHWNGWTWNPMEIRIGDRLASDDLTAVWAFSDRDVWAVGHHGTIVHLDDGVWTQESYGADADLLTLRGLGVGELWAAGDRGTIIHRTGGKWETTVLGDVPATTAFTGISTVAELPNFGLWFLGASPEKLNSATVVLSLFGSFSPMEIASNEACPSTAAVYTTNLTGVVQAGIPGVWAGFHCHDAQDSSPSGGGFIYVDGGAGWATHTSTPAFASQVKGIWAGSEFNLWAVGAQGTVAHFDGKWTECGSTLFPNESPNLNAVWSIGNGGRIWAVGEDMTLIALQP